MASEASNLAIRKGNTTLLVVAVWLAVVIAGFACLFAYGLSSEPEAPIDSIPNRPAADHWTLMVGIHPKCSCSHATAAELDRLLRFIDERVVCEVFWFEPKSGPSFGKTSIVERFARIPGVSVQKDLDGLTMARFNISTSGGVVLWDPNGVPQFAGGITPSRGHEGRSVGADSIVRIVLRQPPYQQSSPTYGCPIRGSDGEPLDDG